MLGADAAGRREAQLEGDVLLLEILPAFISSVWSCVLFPPHFHVPGRYVGSPAAQHPGVAPPTISQGAPVQGRGETLTCTAGWGVPAPGMLYVC